MIKISAFADEIAKDLDTQIATLKKNGIAYLCLRGVDGTGVLDLTDNELDTIRKRLQAECIGVSSIGSPIGKVPFEDDPEQEYKRLERAIHVAHVLEARYIRAFAFWHPKDGSPDDALDEAARRLKKMAALAEAGDVVLILENDSELLCDTPERCRALLERVDSPHLRAAFDFANYVREGVDPFTRAWPLLADYVGYVHIKDMRVADMQEVPSGEGDGQMEPIFGALKTRGYHGFMTLEPHLAASGRFDGFTGPDLFDKAANALKTLLDKTGIGYGPLGLGIFGTGTAATMHADAVQRLPDVEIRAAYDTDPKQLQTYCEKYGVTAEPELDRFLARDDIQLVSVCVPSGLHAVCAIKVASAGKHVLVEKPIDINVDHAQVLIDTCKQKDVILSVISQHRFDPGALEIKEAVESGRLGKLVLADGYVKWYRTQEYYDSGGWRGTWELDGGGAMINQSIHTVDVLRWIAGDIRSVFARVGTLAHEIDVEDTCVVTLEFANGAIGVFEGTTAAYPGFNEGLDIHGTKGSMLLRGAHVIERDIAGEDRYVRKPDREESTGSADPTAAVCAGHVRQIQDLRDAIVEGRDSLIPGEEGRDTLAVILAIYESARTGQPVQLRP